MNTSTTYSAIKVTNIAIKVEKCHKSSLKNGKMIKIFNRQAIFPLN